MLELESKVAVKIKMLADRRVFFLIIFLQSQWKRFLKD